jgi:hypothetical protein
MTEVLQAPSAAETRRIYRRRLLRDGQIIILKGWSRITCTIRDTGTGGARLAVKAECKLPRRFDLFFITDQKLIPCEMRWRRGERLGVRFT